MAQLLSLPRDITHNYLLQYLQVSTFLQYCQLNRTLATLNKRKEIWDAFLFRDYQTSSPFPRTLYQMLFKSSFDVQTLTREWNPEMIKFFDSFPLLTSVKSIQVEIQLRPSTHHPLMKALTGGDSFPMLTSDKSNQVGIQLRPSTHLSLMKAVIAGESALILRLEESVIIPISTPGIQNPSKSKIIVHRIHLKMLMNNLYLTEIKMMIDDYRSLTLQQLLSHSYNLISFVRGWAPRLNALFREVTKSIYFPAGKASISLELNGINRRLALQHLKS